jgi:DNA-binding MarR family transcriptional regulator
MTERASLEALAFPPLGGVLDMLRLIWQVDHELHRTSRQMERTLGVTAPQRLVIRIVGRFPGIPAGRLAQLLHVHPGTLSGILARLERHGFVQRWTDPHDRRRSLVGLSARGRKLDAESTGTVEAAIAEAIASVSADKLAAARELFEAIAQALARANARTSR